MACLELQKMRETGSRLAQATVRGIDFRIAKLAGATPLFSSVVAAIRMQLGGKCEELLFKRVRVEPRLALLAKRREIIRHALKLSPHEQLVAAFGFFTLNPPSSVSR